MLINNDDFASHWIDPKPREINVTFNGTSLQHDVVMGTLQPAVTADQCIVVEQDDVCK